MKFTVLTRKWGCIYKHKGTTIGLYVNGNYRGLNANEMFYNNFIKSKP